jgi:hypothetical protein
MALRLEASYGTWILPMGVTVIGRGDDCGVRINDPRLSRHHARIEALPAARLLAHDMGSANGVLVNGDRIVAPRPLLPGDEMVCGPVRFVVRSNDTPPPAAIVSESVSDEARAGDQPRRSRTEQMDSQEVVREIAKSRQLAEGLESGVAASAKLNPAIAAAVTAHLPGSTPAPDTARPERHEGSTSMHPSEMVPAIGSTSALSPHRFHPPSPPMAAQVTAKLFPSEAPLHSSGALEMGHLTQPAGVQPGFALQRLRLLAGLGDPLLSLVLGVVLGLPLAIAGLIVALLLADAGVANGMVTLPGVPQAALGEVVAHAVTPATWWQLDTLARQLHALASPWPFMIFLLSLAVATVVAEICVLWRLVFATVHQGGPWLHRRLGLRIAVRRNGHHPSWLRAVGRWAALAATWPLAVLTAGLGWRGLHDVLSGCEVRTQR